MMKFVIYKYGITKPALVSVTLERDNYLILLTRSPEIFDEWESVLLLPSFAKEIKLTLGEIFEWLIK